MDSKNEIISWSEFEKVDLRTGTIIRAEEFPEARSPAYKLWVDLGPIGIKKSSAQVTEHYTVQDLIGKQVVCVVNFAEKQIGPFLSQILVTGFADDTVAVVLTSVDSDVPNCTKLF